MQVNKNSSFCSGGLVWVSWDLVVWLKFGSPTLKVCHLLHQAWQLESLTQTEAPDKSKLETDVLHDQDLKCQ